MQIQGTFNSTHVIREFFLCEYAFELHWSGRNMIRVAHKKGTWTIAKMKSNDEIVEAFEIDDMGNTPAIIFSPPSGFVLGFLASRSKEVPFTRFAIADALTDLLNVWGGRLQDIDRIEVIQPGRNAWIGEKGNFELAPRPEDWKK